MSRTPATFKQCDVRRAGRAGLELFGENVRVLIRPDGTICIEKGDGKPEATVEAREEIRL